MKVDQNKKFSHRASIRQSGARGFSLLEMMIVCCLILIVAGIGFMAVQPALKDARVNQAYENVMMPLRVARQRAIAERKQYIVCFGVAAPAGALTPMGAPTAQSVQIFRWDAGTALSSFDLFLSIQYVAMIIIGGMGSLLGALLGAAFVTIFPYAIEALLKLLPNVQRLAGDMFAVNYAAFGVVMILFLVLEPLGLVGIWRRVQSYFLLWPFKHQPLAGARK